MGKKKYRKPNWFVYSIFRFLSKVLSKFKFNLDVTNNEIRGKKGSYVKIANHETSIGLNFLVTTAKRSINFL